MAVAALYLSGHHVCCSSQPVFGASGRTMVLRFLSRTVQLARHSSSPLGRPLCSASANKPVLTLFTKKPCPLCDEAKEVLEPHKKRFILQEVDITLPENSSWEGNPSSHQFRCKDRKWKHLNLEHWWQTSGDTWHMPRISGNCGRLQRTDINTSFASPQIQHASEKLSLGLLRADILRFLTPLQQETAGRDFFFPRF
ncbi:glutaredoxin-like protein C5orf63 homolog isoform X3 [Apteryx rowi]|uniref:glutaredoxin-like protein C5orf63 homolog isoform X3 n=1 Tax=Apteryx rowi TaxID=308060 RepID=UPI000E1E2A38|nr:glutaredoxin-like protein C5orf63 homolog isoform X3 [Apteryx rowi]